ncbi:hypothetical protein [Celeribacter marinus]|uniref:hypothetical protein n=1 Tax=Celeribacter marinus TaxID=1397108 RepID=UPI003F6C3364
MSLLLSAQVAFAHMPITEPVDDNHIATVLCGPDGFTTIIMDLSDGSIEVKKSDTVQDRCPLCVLGAIALVDEIDAPQAQTQFDRVPQTRVYALAVLSADVDRAKPIRAPPASL